jgi:DNA gyrase subunit B
VTNSRSTPEVPHTPTELSLREAARRRPGMYVGSTDRRGLEVLVWGVARVGLNAHIAGRTNHLRIQINLDNSVSISFMDRSAADTFETGSLDSIDSLLTSGAELPYPGPYCVEEWLGDLSVTNALSSRFIAQLQHGCVTWRHHYQRGIPIGKPRVAGTPGGKHETRVAFWPDTEIFGNATLDADTILDRARELCYLNPELTIEVRSHMHGLNAAWAYHYPEGVRTYVRSLSGGILDPIWIRTKHETTLVDVALQFTWFGEPPVIHSFVNNYRTSQGGTHVTGFRRAINDWWAELGISPAKRLGVVAVVSVWIEAPELEGSTHSKLGNELVINQVRSVVASGLAEHFERVPDELMTLKRIVGQ